MAVSTVHYQVTGMHCAHCVKAVTDEVSALPGVVEVKVDLVPHGNSVVAVSGEGNIERSAVVEAVSEAGYAVKEYAVKEE